MFKGNAWIAATQQNRKEFDPPIVLQHHATLDIIERGANLFPMVLMQWPDSEGLFGGDMQNARRLADPYVNLSDTALAYLNMFKGVTEHPTYSTAVSLYCTPRNTRRKTAQPFARTGHAYRCRHPPTSRVRRIGPESGRLAPSGGAGRRRDGRESRPTCVYSARNAGRRRRLSGDNFAVTARWGISGKGGITAGEGGLTARSFTADEAAALGDVVISLPSLPDTVNVWLQ